jgi:mycofactocin precursor
MALEVVATKEAVESAADTGEEPVEDVLVEEVSIDGMCGVY